MRRAIASLLSFAATCLYAPALADELAVVFAPGLAATAGYAGTRLLTYLCACGAANAHKLQSNEPPRQKRCPPRKTSSTP